MPPAPEKSMTESIRGTKMDGNRWYRSAGISSLPAEDPAFTASSPACTTFDVNGLKRRGNAVCTFSKMGRLWT